MRHGIECGMGRAALIIAAAVVTIGCGNGTGIVPVSGTVTFDGAAPPGGGTVWFTAVESAEGFPMRPATGDFGSDGKFAAKSHEPGDGLYPGTYKVYLTCWERPPAMGGPPPISYLPVKYQSTTTAELDLVVEPGSKAMEFDVDVKTSGG